MRRASVVLAAFALVLSACGDTATTEVTATTPGDAAATIAPTPATTEQPTDGQATLADYLPMYGGPDDPAEQEAYWRQQEIQAQEYTARCMAEQGFEYIPYSPQFEDSFVDWEATEGERRAEQGFGMAYWVLFEEEAVEQYEEEWSPEDDPNWAITEAMSESEREAYYYALHGEDPWMEADFDWENATEEEIRAFEEEMDRLYMEREWIGCSELGWQEAGGFDDDVWMSFEDEFGNFWEEVDQRVQADPRFIEIQDEWRTCMADAGFEFTDQEDMWMQLDEEFTRIVDWPGDEGPGGPAITIAPGIDLDSLEFVENDDGTVQWVDAAGNVYTEEDMDALWAPTFDETELREFMEHEISVAVAEWDCSQGMWEQQGAIFTEYQNQWVAENKDALDAWKAGREAEG
jgi:hypothetical protein